MIYLEVELSIALKEFGTLCVLVAGKTMDVRQGWSVEALDMI